MPQKLTNLYTPIAIASIIHFTTSIIFGLYIRPHSNQQLLYKFQNIPQNIISNLITFGKPLNFDGIHYFNNQYLYEPSYAFLPGYVAVISAFKHLLSGRMAILALVTMNHILFILAALDLIPILRHVFRSLEEQQTVIQEKTYMGFLLFLFNPASIFFHSIYTESLFCFLTFKAIKWQLQSKNLNIISIILFGLAISIRSNGLFLSPFIGLDLILKLWHHFQQGRYKESLLSFLRGLGVLAIFLTPFICYLVFCHINLCLNNPQQPDVCSNPLPNLYSFVQKRYWNVGFLTYFKPSNSLFIIIGTPAILISFYSFFLYRTKLQPKINGLFLSFWILLSIIISLTNIQSSTRFLCTHPLFYICLTTLTSRWKIIGIWSLFYYLLGNFLFIGGFPWT